MLTIDRTTARRFILGKHGLWPGRRWRGAAGVDQAMRAMEYLQLDPLQVVARSHDIALHSRVLDYTPGLWEERAYRQRLFFDWGGWLAVRPMDELAYWRVVMRRERDGDQDCDARIPAMGREHADAVAEMRRLLTERGTLGNRDFEAAARTRTQHYRGRKDSALALYYLWRTGAAMTHHRDNFERVYALTEAVAPPDLLHAVDDAAVDRFLIAKEVRFAELSRLNRTSDAYFRGVPFSRAKQLREPMLTDDELIAVRVEGWKATYVAASADAELLSDVSAGRIPAAWAPLDAAADEVVFLAPLDPVCARGRAKELFDFDYVWEVYKPAPQRRFGYYTLPVLWGDRLVARFDSAFDRAGSALRILGLWLEDAALGADEPFAEALARGFARFGRFLGASRLDPTAINAPLLRHSIAAAIASPGAV